MNFHAQDVIESLQNLQCSRRAHSLSTPRFWINVLEFFATYQLAEQEKQSRTWLLAEELELTVHAAPALCYSGQKEDTENDSRSGLARSQSDNSESHHCKEPASQKVRGQSRPFGKLCVILGAQGCNNILCPLERRCQSPSLSRWLVLSRTQQSRIVTAS